MNEVVAIPALHLHENSPFEHINDAAVHRKCLIEMDSFEEFRGVLNEQTAKRLSKRMDTSGNFIDAD